jgi:hypothetical protein
MTSLDQENSDGRVNVPIQTFDSLHSGSSTAWYTEEDRFTGPRVT